MGKSTAGSILQRLRIPIIDTDQLARDLTAPGQETLGEIATAFGNGVLESSGALNRPKLADLVFRDPAALRRLEAILHPRIQAQWRARAAAWRADGAPVGVVIIPLLHEKGYAGEFDATVCVACSTGTQQERLRERGWNPEEIARRSAAQLPVGEKLVRSRFVVWTEGRLTVHEEQWRRILRVVGVATCSPA